MKFFSRKYPVKKVIIWNSEGEYIGGGVHTVSQEISVVAKKLGCRLKVKLRQLKEGAKHFAQSVEVPVVLYQVITG